MIYEQTLDNPNLESLRHHYFKDGCVILRGLVDTTLTSAMNDAWCKLFRAILSREGVTQDLPNDLDTLLELTEQTVGPDRARHFHTMGRDFPQFQQLVFEPKLQQIIKSILDSETIQSVADNNTFRIDRPNTGMTSLDWHQDYPYNMQSMSAATAWIPILPVTGNMGRLKIAPGCKTIHPITFDWESTKVFHSSSYVRMTEIDRLRPKFEDTAIVAPDLYPGDVLLLHGLVAHQSGMNTSSKARWVATARYADFMDKALYDRNWYTMRAKYPDLFSSVHPELCTTIGDKGN